LGHHVIVQHLGQIMLVQALRMYLAQQPHLYPSWLQAISDPRIGPVMQAIHQHPAQSWTVAALAQIAGLSRSSFALRFKQKAGMPPLTYVARWRILLALGLLRANHSTISTIAQQLGYDSDSAFSHAFKRMLHCSPRDYRAQQQS
jgi:AraC-like DNA-binding protein